MDDLFLCTYRASGTVYYPDQQMQNIYIRVYICFAFVGLDIYNIYFICIVNTPTCFDATASSSGSPFLLLC